MNAENLDLMSEFERLLFSGPEKDEEGSWKAKYCIAPDFIGFQGHFPDYPLMPAVMQSLLAVHMLQKALGCKLSLESLPTAKFTGQVRPDDELLCQAKALDSKDSGRWEVNITRGEQDGEVKKISSFRLSFKA